MDKFGDICLKTELITFIYFTVTAAEEMDQVTAPIGVM
jgi:hypothetical protein